MKEVKDRFDFQILENIINLDGEIGYAQQALVILTSDIFFVDT